MKLRIIWRGRHLSPLLIIGKYTLWFTKGIVFGRKANSFDVTYYIGWLIISAKTAEHPLTTKRIECVNNGTWPKYKIWR